jgi:hypothetical protein
LRKAYNRAFNRRKLLHAKILARSRPKNLTPKLIRARGRVNHQHINIVAHAMNAREGRTNTLSQPARDPVDYVF